MKYISIPYMSRMAREIYQKYKSVLCIEVQFWHNRTEYVVWIDNLRNHFYFDDANKLVDFTDWLLAGKGDPNVTPNP